MIRKRQGAPPTWCSVDGASRRSGVAFWRGAELTAVTTLRGLGWPAWKEALGGLAGIVLEDGYVGRGRSARTALVLADARGRIKGYAAALDVSLWATWLPAEWRRRVGIPAGASRAHQKAAARAKVRWLAAEDRPASGGMWDQVHLPRAGDVSEDEAEAILLGLAWLVDRGQVGSSTRIARSIAPDPSEHAGPKRRS